MSQYFSDLNNSNKQITNELINESERNATIVTETGNYSVFDKSFQHATTFDSGKCIPVLFQEVLPGDIYEIDPKTILRLSAPSSTPFMNINYDINFFFVPLTQLDPEFKQVMGENPDYGYSDTNLEFPILNFTNGLYYNENDLANYLGIPINTKFMNDKFNLYPFLAYGKIWNEWYRDQNLQSSINVTSCFNESRSIDSINYKSNMSFYESIIYGKGLAPASKFPSYFTSCLPYQQKGLPIPVGNLDISKLSIGSLPLQNDYYHKVRPKVYNNGLDGSPTTFTNNIAIGSNSGGDLSTIGSNGNHSQNAWFGLSTSPTTGAISYAPGGVPNFNVNDLRNSIVTQHLLENWALCGSRYVEQLKSIWGIEIDPKNINRTELIGGVNETLKFNNIQQTSATTSSSQLGNIASSLYNFIDNPKIEYASSQHGIIMAILVCRTSINNGGQGLPRYFKYNDMFDLHNPLFNGIGEQPIYNYEIYYNSFDANDPNKDLKNNDTFGFNEPFLNTKYNIDSSSGFMSLRSNTSLFSMFLFGEKYNDHPLLSDEWIQFNPNIIGNTLFNVNGSNKEFYHQFIAIFTYQIKYTTKQPLFNSPKVYGI